MEACRAFSRVTQSGLNSQANQTGARFRLRFLPVQPLAAGHKGLVEVG